MYNTKTATTNNEEFSSNYMPVGINSGVVLKEVNCNKTPQGRDFLEIVFENENGQTAPSRAEYSQYELSNQQSRLPNPQLREATHLLTHDSDRCRQGV